MKRHILAWIVLATVAFGLPQKSFLTQWKASKSGDTHFTITFDSGTPPATVVLGVGATYAGPAGAEATAEYDAGDGVWTGYTSNTITLNGDYLKFRGDWRTSAGTYANMFYSSFQSSAYTCGISGTLGYAATVNYAYEGFFRENTTVMTLADNPFQSITGSPAAYMFYYTFFNSSFTGTLPTGTLDTSGLTGAPATYMFFYTFYRSGFTGTLPAGTLDTSGLTGAPAAYMFRFTFGRSSFTGTLPDGTLDTNGLTGAPATYMFGYTFFSSSFTGILPAGALDTSGLTGAPAAYMFLYTFGRSSFTGTLPDGTLDTSGLTGAPATYMFFYTFFSSSFTGILPAGTLDTSGLTGAPAASMFLYTFNNSKLTGGNLTLGSGITLTSANVVGPLTSMFSGASDWTGQVYWGTTLLTTAIPAPDSDIGTFAGCVNMPGYATIDANWK